MADFLADTYALVEILKGSPNYKKYSRKSLITTEFNMLELSYALYRDFGDRAAEMLKLVRVEVDMMSTSDEDYVRAAKMRIAANRDGKNLSLIDCLGYTCAETLKVRFLTGDRAFEQIKNVEYVK